MQDYEFLKFTFQKQFKATKMTKSQLQLFKDPFAKLIDGFADEINFQSILDQNKKPYRKNNIYNTSRTRDC